jgi:hypothetical protein
MRTAEFLEDKYDTVSHLQPSTIYRLSAKNIPEQALEGILAQLVEHRSLSDIKVNALIDDYLRVDASVPDASSEVPSRSTLVAAWQTASASDRSELVSSLRAALVNSAWQFLSSIEKAAFVFERNDEITALLSGRSQEHASDGLPAGDGNVVQLFADAPSIVQDDEVGGANSASTSHH